MTTWTAHEAQVTTLTGRLVRWAEINSGSGNLPGLERMRTELATAFGTLRDAAIEQVPLVGTSATALRVRIRPGAKRQVLLSGHYDTVYEADHAFQRCTRLDAERLRGPGVADMKGGLLVMLAGLRLFQSRCAQPPFGVEVLLTPDEETGSPSSRALLEATARSGRFSFALVFEPARANGDLVRTRKGTGVFTATCHGRAAHAGRDPSAGRNAILALAEFLQAAALEFPPTGTMTLNVGNFRGGGAVNIVPDFAQAQCDVRTTCPEDERRVLTGLAALAERITARDGYRLELSGDFNRPPKPVLPGEEGLFALWQDCGRRIGLNLGWQDVGGASDGNLFAASGLPSLDGLGPVGDRVHSPEEFVFTRTILERAHLLATALERFSKPEFSWPASCSPSP